MGPRGTRTCVRFPNRSAELRRRVADDTRLTTREATPDLGLSQIFKDFSTSTQSSQTHGVHLPRCQEHYETQSFSPKNPTSRRSSTSPWRVHPPLEQATRLPRVWDLAKFSRILQLLHRAPKLMECTHHPSSRRLGLPRVWDLVKFSKILQLLHRAPKLVECTSLDGRSTTRHSSFQKKIQPADALRLPHGGFTPRAGDSDYRGSGT